MSVAGLLLNNVRIYEKKTRKPFSSSLFPCIIFVKVSVTVSVSDKLERDERIAISPYFNHQPRSVPSVSRLGESYDLARLDIIATADQHVAES